MKAKDIEEIKRLLQEVEGERGVTPKQVGGGNGHHKTNWLQILKNHFTDIKGVGWSDENLFTIDGIVDDILADTITISGGALPDDPVASSLARYIASGGTALGEPLPENMSLIDLLGDFVGAHDGVLQASNVKASLDLAHIDLGDILADTITISGGALPDDPVENSLARFIASGGTALGAPLPENMSLIDLLGDFTGAHDGGEQDDNVKASLDLAHIDLDDIISAIAAIVTTLQAYQEQIPDTDIELLVIDNVLTADPPGADEENSVVDIDIVANTTFVLRSLWVNISTFGTDATKLTFSLWVPLKDAAVTEVDSVDVTVEGLQNLMDLFGLPEVHADGIWITVVSDGATADAQLTGSYRYAKAQKAAA